MDERLLELLKGAGIDTSDEGKLGGLEAGIRNIYDALHASEVEALTKKRDEFEARMKGQDAKISEYDLKVKALEKDLLAARAATPLAPATLNTSSADFEKALERELAPIRETVLKMAESAKEQAAELERQRARNEWREAVDKLAVELPILADPKFAALLPQTTDVEQLRQVGETLTTFASATKEDAYKQVRDGFVPPSQPPRVSPDKPGEFVAAMEQIRAEERSGAINAREAQAKIQRLATLMKPKE